MFYRLVHVLFKHREAEIKPEAKANKLITNAKYCKSYRQKSL